MKNMAYNYLTTYFGPEFALSVIDGLSAALQSQKAETDLLNVSHWASPGLPPQNRFVKFVWDGPCSSSRAKDVCFEINNTWRLESPFYSSHQALSDCLAALAYSFLGRDLYNLEAPCYHFSFCMVVPENMGPTLIRSKGSPIYAAKTSY